MRLFGILILVILHFFLEVVKLVLKLITMLVFVLKLSTMLVFVLGILVMLSRFLDNIVLKPSTMIFFFIPCRSGGSNYIFRCNSTVLHRIIIMLSRFLDNIVLGPSTVIFFLSIP
jgi:hypothetical protein